MPAAVNTHGAFRSAFSASPASRLLRQDEYPTIAIAVVGSRACGKTNVVRKGLKGYALSDPLILDSPVLHVARQGKVPRLHDAPEQTFAVLEVDSAALRFDPFDPRTAWPPSLPNVNGVMVCYDVSQEASFHGVRELIHAYCALKLPVMVLACKTDLPRQVEPRKAAGALSKLEVGLVEVTVATDSGKDKLRASFDWLIKAILRARRHAARLPPDAGPGAWYRNPASPHILFEPAPWDERRSENAAPTPSSSIPFATSAAAAAAAAAAPPPTITATTPDDDDATAARVYTMPADAAPHTPTRARSMNDLLTNDRTRSRDLERESSVLSLRPESAISTTTEVATGDSTVRVEVQEPPKKLLPPRWQTVDDLLQKLLFVGIAGDDPHFIWRFLLVYRCFATPRTLLLAMQKALRGFDASETIDPMFARFAQTRICHILDVWIKDYPSDFAVPGAAGALGAIVKSVLSKIHLLHYSSTFLPFLELIPSLNDNDAIWAVKPTELDVADDPYSDADVDEDDFGVPVMPAALDSSSSEPGEYAPSFLAASSSLADSPISARLSLGAHGSSSSVDRSPTTRTGPAHQQQQQQPAAAPMLRERKPSLPLRAGSSQSVASSSVSSGTAAAEERERQFVAEFKVVSADLNFYDAGQIAIEMNRIQQKMFLDIRPRDWIFWAYRYAKKSELSDPVSRFLTFVNHIADWIASLILCHDKPKFRAKQIERLMDIAKELRDMHNYSACRSFVAGINNTVSEGDMTMSMFENKAPEKYKMLKTYNSIFKNQRAHGAYRLALKGAKGACIPDVEVHATDILKAHEGNINSDPEDPSKIHWAKWNMMAKFVHELEEIQDRARVAMDEESVAANPHTDMSRLDTEGEKRLVMERQAHSERVQRQYTTIAQLWRESVVMPPEIQRARMAESSRAGGGDHTSTLYERPFTRVDSIRTDKQPSGRDSVLKKLFR